MDFCATSAVRYARVVLPVPGGPVSTTCLPASMAATSWSRTCAGNAIPSSSAARASSSALNVSIVPLCRLRRGVLERRVGEPRYAALTDVIAEQLVRRFADHLDELLAEGL